MRRVLLVVIVFALREVPEAQFALYVVLNVVGLIWHIVLKPLKDHEA